MTIKRKSRWTLTLTRTPTDPRVSSDSHLLHQLKRELRTRTGLDWIKIRMAKDGHLVGDDQQYVCTRDRKRLIYQSDYATRELWRDYNAYQPVILATAGLRFKV